MPVIKHWLPIIFKWLFQKYSFWLSLGILIATIFLSKAAREQRRAFFDRVISYQSEGLFHRIQYRSLDMRNALNRMSARVIEAVNNYDKIPTIKNAWRTDARQYLEEFPGLTTLFIADLQMKVVDTISQTDSHNITGYEFAYESPYRTVFENASFGRQEFATDVQWPKHNPNQLSLIFAVGTFDVLEGYLVAIIEPEKWFTSLELERFFVVQAHSGATLIYQSPNFDNEKVFKDYENKFRLQFGTIDWNIRFLPKSSAFNVVGIYFSTMIFGFGLILSVLTFVLGALSRRYMSQAAELHKSRERLSAIVQGIPDGIYIFDSEGLLQETLISNNLIRFVVGSQNISKDIDVLFPVKGYLLKNMIGGVIKSNKTFRFEFDRKDSLFCYTFEGRLLKLAQDEVLVIIRDITEEKNLQRKLEESKAKEIHAAKMAELGEVAGGVAHEINNPLAIIQGSVDHMLKNIRSTDLKPPILEKLANNINTTVKRISNIVQGLRVFAHDGTQDPLERVSLNYLVDEAIVLCNKRIIDLGIELKTLGLEKEITIEGRETQIIQVLVNLINNSCDALEALDERWIEIKIDDRGSDLDIIVTDSGKGIPPQLIEKIMTPFFTTKAVGKGTGLGLSIVRGIVRSHHGKIMVDSDCPHTRFVITFPKNQELERLIA